VPDAGAFDIAVIGAGAAGLMAAIFSRPENPELRVVTFDGASRIGAKILISGGGRCNVTHDVVRAEDFNGGSRNSIARILRTFTVDQTVEFFRDLGVHLKREETGKLFPVTDRAATVLQALLREAGDVRAGHRVRSIAVPPRGFELVTARGNFTARRVIIATGGMSVPKTGSDGAGFGFVRTLGHSVTPTFPALVPLLLPGGHWLTGLSGISVEAELVVGGHRERGSMLLTHFGLSGPVVLDISRHWIASGRGELRANLLPDLDFSAVEKLLTARPSASVQTVLEGHFPERLATALLRDGCEVDPQTRGSQLTRDGRRRIAHALTALPLPVTGDRGFNYAEVTAGGVPLDEIDPRTMASRRCPGLYLCGEILDVDGKIGGYNFQWAWTTGRLAGGSAAGALSSS
jgi:predicted Rossmann fold flavoprotein